MSVMKIIVSASFFIFLSGCACDEYTQPQDSLTRALRRNVVSTFMDSSNNYLQILVFDTNYQTTPADFIRDNYRDDCLDYYPRTIGMFYPNIPGKRMYYSQANWELQVNDVGPHLTTEIPDSTLNLRGYEFTHCHYYQQTDSVGVKQELALSPEYGIVLFSYRDQYRWERVLNP